MRALIVVLVRFALHTFYRVRRLGRSVPADGPLLLVANHPNGLVDPAFLLSATDRSVRFIGKAPLLSMPVLGAVIRAIGLIPVYRPQDATDTTRNVEAFAAVRAALHEGAAVAIFPEGRSHDEPALQQLKTGAARMALAVDPAVAGEVRIVPIGLVYSDKGRLRSRAAIWIGEPVDGADLRPANGAACDGEPDREAVAALTARLGDALRRVTVNLEHWEEWDLLHLAERVWQPARGSRRVERLSQLAAAAARLRQTDPERLDALTRRIAAFRQALDQLGLPADRLDQRYRPLVVARYLGRELALLALAGPIVLVGLGFWLPPAGLVRLWLHLRPPNRDLRATVAVLVAAVLFPLWLAVAIALVGIAFGAVWAVSLAILGPILGRAALPLFEEHLRLAREIRLFVRHWTGRGLRQELIAEREALAAEFESLARSETP